MAANCHSSRQQRLGIWHSFHQIPAWRPIILAKNKFINMSLSNKGGIPDNSWE
uniref:Uncharacterized protein n=1 Tax=Rhizophora mucronata TaxID=61149 RepID=A0A2P2JD34_RHIMU